MGVPLIKIQCRSHRRASFSEPYEKNQIDQNKVTKIQQKYRKFRKWLERKTVDTTPLRSKLNGQSFRATKIFPANLDAKCKEKIFEKNVQNVEENIHKDMITNEPQQETITEIADELPMQSP